MLNPNMEFALEYFEQLNSLVIAQQAVIDEHADKSIANGARNQRCGNGTVDGGVS